jgi:hypothetical protein
MDLIAAVHSDSDVSISVLGIILGIILGVLVYVFCDWAAGRTGYGLLRVVGVLLGLVIFVLLAFDF